MARGLAADEAMVRYEDIAFAAFGRLGQQLVSLVMYTELVGTCALLVILQSDNLWDLVAPKMAEQGASAFGPLGGLLSSPGRVFWFAAALLGVTITAPNVKSLSILGLCGFVATVTVSAAVALVLFTGAPLQRCSRVRVHEPGSKAIACCLAHQL